MEQFLSNLSHPGYTFLDVLFTLKDLAAEGEKISRDKKCIMHLMQKVCERIGCRPVNFLYELFGSFLEKTINIFPQYISALLFLMFLFPELYFQLFVFHLY